MALWLGGGASGGVGGAGELRAALVEARRASGSPAMGVAVTRLGEDGERVTVIEVDGERASGTGVEARVDDAWHIGSITKSMTAVLAARLVDRGLLDWETTIEEGLPELAAEGSVAYREVTLAALLSHRSGLPVRDGRVESALRRGGGSLVERRRRLVGLILRARPIAPPGAREAYSNLGYMVAGSMLERAGGASWEELLLREVCEPLGMEGVGFGAPGDGMVDAPDALWGHRMGADGQPRGVAPGPLADNAATMGPAGTVHAPLDALSAYAGAWLATVVMLRDGTVDDEVMAALGISVGSARRLTTAGGGEDGDGSGYALGVVVGRDSAGRLTRVWHNGSNTLWYAEMLIRADATAASGVVVVTNSALAGVRGAVSGLAGVVVEPGWPEADGPGG